MQMKIKTDIRAGEGIGDAVANLTHLAGVDRLAGTYEDVTGKSCGCEARKEKLNSLSLPGLALIRG
jgi:hypothetical protein